MSWDIILFNSKEKIESIEDVYDAQLDNIFFDQIFQKSFSEIIIDDNHCEIKGKDFSIDYFIDPEPSSNFMVSLYGENGLYELILLARKYGWQIYDTGSGEMIDLDNPEKNGYSNHMRYIQHIKTNR